MGLESLLQESMEVLTAASQLQGFQVENVPRSPCVHVGFLWVLQFSPISKNMPGVALATLNYHCVCECMCIVPCLASHPGCIPFPHS